MFYSALSKDGLPFLHTVILNLNTGEVTRQSVLPASKPFSEGMDFPQLRRSLVGRKNRFGYCTTFNSMADAVAEVKVDLQVRFRRRLVALMVVQTTPE